MPDYSFISKTQVPSAMAPISGMLDMAHKAQSLQTGNVELQKQQIQLGERKGIQQLFSNPQAFTESDGRVNYDKLINEGMKVAPTTFPQMVPQIITAHTQGIAARKALTDLDNTQRDAVGQYVLTLGNDDPATGKKKLDALAASRPDLKPAVDFFWQYNLAPSAQNPEAWKRAVLNVGQGVMAPSAQVDAMTPGGAQLDTGANKLLVNTKPLAGPVGTFASVRNELPPTTPVFDPNTNTPRYAGSPGVQSGPSLGTTSNVEGTVKTVNDDWQTTAANAKTAAQDVGVLQEIKKYAKGAATGVAADRRSLVSGIAGMLGMDAGDLMKTNTDLLAKNSNMLALAGGDTNLARTMAEMANPNIHMTENAIRHAADQVIAQRQMAIIRQQFLAGFKDRPDEYTKKMAQFNKIADPRVLQLATMSPEDKAKMKASMSPKEQKDFGQKIRAWYDMGLLQ